MLESNTTKEDNVFYKWSKQDILKFFFQKNVLIDPDFADAVSSGRLVINKESLNALLSHDFDILTPDVFNNLINKDKELNTPLSEDNSTSDSYSVKIIKNYLERPKKKGVFDFVKHYNNRYKQIESLLKNRTELKNLTTINKVLNKRERSQVSIIGMLNSSSLTRRDSLALTFEDPTGSIKVWVRASQKEVLQMAKSIPLDSVVGINGYAHNKTISANEIILPDIPHKELKKGPEEVYAIFLSDLHIGSNQFLEKDFNKFLSWIDGSLGNDKHREIAKKVKYVFITGDIVDGVGIYKGQDNELVIKDVAKQYEAAYSLLSKIPKDKALIIIPGNHDAIRLAEPQPALNKDYAAPLAKLENAFLLSNPSIVNIASTKNFSGFDVLIYHGFSFD